MDLHERSAHDKAERVMMFRAILPFLTLPCLLLGIILVSMAMLMGSRDVPVLGISLCLLSAVGSYFLSKPLRMSLVCPHCRKANVAADDWVCGYCDFTNTDTRKHPFVRRCQKCERAPAAFECVHCERPIALTNSNDLGHPARPVKEKAPEAVATTVDPRIEKAKQRQEQKDEAQHEIEMAELKLKLAKLKASQEFSAEKSAREKLGEKYSTYEADVMGLRMLERKEREKAAEQYKDDPEMLEMSNLTLDAFIEDHGQQPRRL